MQKIQNLFLDRRFLEGKYDVFKVRDQTRLPGDDANFPFLQSPLSKSRTFVFAHDSANYYECVDERFSGKILSKSVHIDVGIIKMFTLMWLS